MAGRPDPRPTRFLVAMSGFAAATAIAASLIQPGPTPVDDGLDAVAATPAPTTTATAAPAVAVRVRRETRYVQLQPGETAPPGATVVRRAGASPRVVVVTIPAPPPAAAPATRTAAPAPPAAAAATAPNARTRQSGS